MEKVEKFWMAEYILLLGLLILGLAGIVYSWLVFLLILLTILGAVLAWRYMPRILVILPALIPFLPALNPQADIDLAASRLVIVFLFVIGSIYIVYTKRNWFYLSTPTVLILFFLFWSLSSVIMADDKGIFLRKYLVFLTIFPLYFLLLAFLRRREQWQKLFEYWSWSAFIVSFIGLGQFLFQFIGGQQLFFKFWGNYVAPVLYGTNAGEAVASNPSWFVNISGITVLRAIGTFPDPHMLAFFLGMTLPIQAALALKRMKYYWILPGLSLLVLLLTFSRGSYVGLAGVILWLAIYFWRNYPQKRQRILVGALLIILLSSILPPVRDRFTSILDVYEGSNKGRLEIWNEALGITLQNPLLGVGLGNYANAVRPESKYREPIYAHNTYLDLASEIGFPGAIAWILLLYWAVKPLLSFKRENILNLAVALGIGWFALHGFFETPVYSPQILPLILVLIAYRGYFNNLSQTRSSTR